MKKQSGFTLIELMIVIAIIAIIAAIAIPSILRSRISANQTSAIGTLDTILDMNSTFRQNDDDRNGTSDYWSADVFGLWGIHNADGEPIESVNKAVAFSDYEPRTDGVSGGFSSHATVPDSTTASPKSGYWVGMLETYGGGANNYDTGEGTNSSRYCVIAFPDVYDNTGINAFLMQEDGTTWQKDARSNDTMGPFNDANGDPNTAYDTLPVTDKVTDLEGDNWSRKE